MIFYFNNNNIKDLYHGWSNKTYQQCWCFQPHIIIKDTSRKESVATSTKAMFVKANTIQDKSSHKRYANKTNKTDHNNKNMYKYNNLRVAPSNPMFSLSELTLFL